MYSQYSKNVYNFEKYFWLIECKINSAKERIPKFNS
jgi:hypothetical protein